MGTVPAYAGSVFAGGPHRTHRRDDRLQDEQCRGQGGPGLLLVGSRQPRWARRPPSACSSSTRPSISSTRPSSTGCVQQSRRWRVDPRPPDRGRRHRSVGDHPPASCHREAGRSPAHHRRRPGARRSPGQSQRHRLGRRCGGRHRVRDAAGRRHASAMISGRLGSMAATWFARRPRSYGPCVAGVATGISSTFLAQLAAVSVRVRGRAGQLRRDRLGGPDPDRGRGRRPGDLRAHRHSDLIPGDDPLRRDAPALPRPGARGGPGGHRLRGPAAAGRRPCGRGSRCRSAAWSSRARSSGSRRSGLPTDRVGTGTATMEACSAGRRSRRPRSSPSRSWS